MCLDFVYGARTLQPALICGKTRQWAWNHTHADDIKALGTSAWRGDIQLPCKLVEQAVFRK